MHLLKEMLRDLCGARGGPASNPLQNSNCWPCYVCAELQAYPQKSGNHHVVPAVAIINWKSYMFVLSRQGGSVGSSTATDDAPPMRQHMQICAQQQLRAGSWTLMCHRHGSMRGYAHSEDLETGVRCSGAMDRRADGVTTHTLQPPLRLIPSFQRPHAFSACSDRPETRQECRAQVI